MYPTAEPDDHCLVHHFIRTYGRRPSVEELGAMRDRAAVTLPAPSPQHAAMAGGMTAAVRRELARFVNRW